MLQYTATIKNIHIRQFSQEIKIYIFLKILYNLLLRVSYIKYYWGKSTWICDTNKGKWDAFLYYNILRIYGNVVLLFCY